MTGRTRGGRVKLGAHDGPGPRIDAQLGAYDDPDLTLQLPLLDLSGHVLGAFQVSGWAWTITPAAEQRDVNYAVALLGPRGGRHGTSVRLGRGQMQALAITLRLMADHVDQCVPALAPVGIGVDGRESIYATAALDRRGVLGGRLWTQGVRGAGSRPLQPIHPEVLDHCSGLVSLVMGVIA